MKTVLLTAIYGEYDTLHELPDGHGFDEAVCITDNPNLASDSWRILVIDRGNMEPRLAAKLPKMQPFDYVDADIVVWLDGAFQVKSTEFKDFCVKSLRNQDIVVWSHPDLQERNCIAQEAAVCHFWPKYNKYPLLRQVDYYFRLGMPRNFGLWACGTIVWRNTREARDFGRRWLLENIKWSIQDQISFPYLVWRYNIRIGEFQAHEYENPYLTWHRHNSES